MNFGGMQPQIVLLREGTDVSQGARGWSLSFCTAAELCVSRPSRQGAVDKQHQRLLRCGRRCAHDARPPRHGQAHLRRQGHHHQQRRRNHHEGARRAALAMRRAKERPSARGQSCCDRLTRARSCWRSATPLQRQWWILRRAKTRRRARCARPPPPASRPFSRPGWRRHHNRRAAGRRVPARSQAVRGGGGAPAAHHQGLPPGVRPRAGHGKGAVYQARPLGGGARFG